MTPEATPGIAEAAGKSGAEILADSVEQMSLFGRFADNTTLTEMQRYCSAQAEMTARFSERDDKRSTAPIPVRTTLAVWVRWATVTRCRGRRRAGVGDAGVDERQDLRPQGREPAQRTW
jgi:hypothetical protein